MPTGTLYLIPVPIGDSPTSDVIPQGVLERTRSLRHFVVENAKTARAVIKDFGHPEPVQYLSIYELNEHTAKADVGRLLQPLLEGNDVGLMSEAGCPGVADPGAWLVEAAHRHGVLVRPLSGPSSILLALMASGLTGQRFAFHGYLPTRDPERRQALIDLERWSAPRQETQIVIETPYRNTALFAAMLGTLRPDTQLTVASSLSSSAEYVSTRPVQDWSSLSEAARTAICDRRPTVFLILAARTAGQPQVSGAGSMRQKREPVLRQRPRQSAG